MKKEIRQMDVTPYIDIIESNIDVDQYRKIKKIWPYIIGAIIMVLIVIAGALAYVLDMANGAIFALAGIIIAVVGGIVLLSIQKRTGRKLNEFMMTINWTKIYQEMYTRAFPDSKIQLHELTMKNFKPSSFKGSRLGFTSFFGTRSAPSNFGKDTNELIFHVDSVKGHFQIMTEKVRIDDKNYVQYAKSVLSATWDGINKFNNVTILKGKSGKNDFQTESMEFSDRFRITQNSDQTAAIQLLRPKTIVDILEIDPKADIDGFAINNDLWKTTHTQRIPNNITGFELAVFETYFSFEKTKQGFVKEIIEDFDKLHQMFQFLKPFVR